MLRYGLLGKSLKHSLSPIIHKALFKYSKMDADYQLFEYEKFEDFNEKDLGLSGYNVTIPYKENAFSTLEVCDEKARLFSSVNCVDCIKHIGYNTDWYGYSESIKEIYSPNDGDNILLLGAGGVGRMIAHIHSKANLYVAVRDKTSEKVTKLKQELKYAKFVDINEIPVIQYDLIVNGTPVGMFPKVNESPIADEIIKNSKAVFDTIYNPEYTLLALKAQQFGVKVKTGMEMLVLQAAQSHKFWYGAEFDDEFIKEVVNIAYKTFKG